MSTKAFVYLNNVLPATPELAKLASPDDLRNRAVSVLMNGYSHGDPLVLSECAFTSDSDNEFALAAGIFSILNADERPNGDRERSLSVGDLICFMDDAEQEKWLAVKPIGFHRLPDPPDLSTLIQPSHIDFHSVGVGYA